MNQAIFGAISEQMKVLAPTHWKEYELLDSGDFEKLERFGTYILCRPEPQAVWNRSLKPAEWDKRWQARFVQEGSSSGKWDNRGVPDNWVIQYNYGKMTLRFKLALTAFKHVGIFPEQAVNWNFIHDNCQCMQGGSVLNLFAYTGGASLAARAGGADVIHCDSIRQVVSWARGNMETSGLDHIRWLVEDAFGFVKKEARRGKKYNGIIMDPPAWGHGPNGEKWKLEEQINELMMLVSQILDPEKSFLVLNAYSLGFSPLVLENLLLSHLNPKQIKAMESGELYLPERSGRKLPTGVFARFAI
jgi:23S rRNA (cytosine1962-C5)-methyltransferase